MSLNDRPGRARARPWAGPLLFILAGIAAAAGGSSPAANDGAARPGRASGPLPPGLLARAGATTAIDDGAPASPAHGAFESALRSRLAREARRQGVDRGFAPAAPFRLDEEDDAAADGGRRAGRTILRSLRGALDDHLETTARGSGSFAGFFRFLDGRGTTPSRPAPEVAATQAGPLTLAAGASPSTPPARDTVDFGIRLRVDAHPRLLVGGRVGRLEGRVELPLLEREIKMTVEHPIGGVGGAALRGGHSVDRGSWADLALTLRF